jgi:4-amino-4-deoxy-L-arabinose transferase-like glycosyltransferase
LFDFENRMDKRDIRNLVLLGVVVLALLLPFINKPFNVDDPFYLKVAQQIIKDPLHPYSFAINWSGELRDVWQKREATFPPLVPFYIAAIVKFFGEKEWVLHLFFLVFPFTAAVAMYSLSKRFVRSPLLAALLLIATPSFLVSATSIMLDIPLLALMLASLSFFLYGVDKESKGMAAAGAVLCGLALLTKYSAFLLLPLLALAAFTGGRKRYAWFLLLPMAFFLCWCGHNLLVYRELQIFAASKNVGMGISPHKALAFCTFFSGCLVFPVMSLFVAGRKRLCLTAAPAAVVIPLGFLLFGRVMPALQFALLVTATLVFVLRVIARGLAVDYFIRWWFIAALLMVVLLEPWMSGRYLLLLLPPSVLCFTRMIEGFAGEKRRIVAVACIAVTFACGIAFSAADFAWANVYPAMADYVQERGFRPGCFIGHFGFQYYMEKAGLTALEVGNTVDCKGYLVAARIPDPQRPGQELCLRLQTVEERSADSKYPLRLMDQRHGAGFYSSFWGIFPFCVSTAPLDDFVIYTIKG